MKNHRQPIQIVTVALFIMALARLASAGNFTWSGASGPNLFWNTSGNWSLPGSPATNDFAIFFDSGATNVPGSGAVDNEVTANKTIQYLWLSQTNGMHNMLIDPGVTLTVAGTNYNGYGPLGSDPNNNAPTNGYDTLFAGTRNPATAGTGVTNTISGAGSLVLNNISNEMNVRQVFAGSGNVAHQAVLDLSGLNSFIANLGRIRVGDGDQAPLSRAQGQLRLAMTNTITLSGTNSADNDQLVVGNQDVNNNGNSSVSYLLLGRVNTLNLDLMLISGQKQQGQMLLNTNFTGSSVVMRAHDGVGRVSTIRVGDESDAGATSGPSSGTINLLGATSDILADRIILGKGQNGAGAPSSPGMNGTLILGPGALDVNTLQLAVQFVSNQGGPITGTATFSNTVVVVNKLLELGHSTGAAPARNAIVNITGGSLTVASNLVTQGTATINATNTVIALKMHPSVLASILTLDGASISNAAALKITNALTVVNNGDILGNPVLDMGPSPNATWTVSGIHNGALTVSNLLQGAGTINGNVTQAPGATLNPGGTAVAGTLSVNGNVTLNAGTLKFDLSNNGNGINDQINVAGVVTLAGTNAVNLSSLSGAFDTANPYTLISASGGLTGGDQTYFVPAGGLGQSRYTFTFTTDPSTVKLSVAGVGPASLTWVGDGTLNNWDLKNTFNWNNGAAAQFFSLDAVSFTDSGSASPSVKLVGTLNPGSITVSNVAKNYTFSGTGGVTGAALTKDGTGSLTFNNTGDDTFAGPVTILKGASTFGNTGLNTFVGGLTLTGGSASFSGGSTNVINAGTSVTIGVGTSLTVANANANTFNAVPVQLDGSLSFTQSVDSVMDGAITGAGTLTKDGSGALTLSGVNNGLSSVVQINGGTIKAGSTTALGSTGVIITNNGTLDLTGHNLGGLPITVSGAGAGGNGAIVSSAAILVSGSTAIGLSSVTMTGNTTFGGSGPWNTDPIKNVGAWGISGGTLSTGGTNFNLTKVGLNQVSLNNSTVDPALGNIDVQQGLLDLDGSTTGLGDPGSNLTVRASAQVSFNATSTPWDKKFILFGDGATPGLLDYNGANTVIGTVTLNGSCVIGGVDLSRGAPVSITLDNAVGGSGSLTKSGNDLLILNGTNNYAGTTTVNGGSLLVESRNAGTNSITVAGGMLGGIGVIAGPVTVSSGGTLSPGDASTPFGVLSISNRVILGGTFSNYLDKTAGVFSSGMITNITTLTIGGALQLNLTGEPLVAGDSFKLFSFTSATGAFTTINPGQPADGLQWDTSHLTTDGTLRVSSVNATPAPIVTVVNGNQLTLNWPADHTGWRLQVQTNSLGAGLGTNWVDVAGSTLVDSVTVTLNPANGTIFYRMVYP